MKLGTNWEYRGEKTYLRKDGEEMVVPTTN